MVHTLCFILVSCASVTLLLIFMYICNSTFWCSFFCKLGLPQFHLWSKQGRWWTQSCFYSRSHARQVTVDSQSTARSLPRAPSWFSRGGSHARIYSTHPVSLPFSCSLSSHSLCALSFRTPSSSDGRGGVASGEVRRRRGGAARPGGSGALGRCCAGTLARCRRGRQLQVWFFFLFFVAIFYKIFSTRILLWFSMQTFFFKIFHFQIFTLDFSFSCFIIFSFKIFLVKNLSISFKFFCEIFFTWDFFVWMWKSSL